MCLQAEQLRQHYMTKYDSEVADAHQALQPVLQNIKELKRQVGTSSLWSSVCGVVWGGHSVQFSTLEAGWSEHD